MNIAIIGGGASGLMLASKLDKYANITIFERNKGLGRKLLASGNGRANILNINALPSDYNNDIFVKQIFEHYDATKVLDEMSNLGLITKVDEEGRVYPITDSSKSVLDCFLDKIANTRILLEYEVKSISKVNNKYRINDYNELFDYVICASGSIAGIESSKQNGIYNYLKKYKIKFTDLKESLVGFKTVDKSIKQLSGFRSKANVKLYINNKLIHEEKGEVLFKDDGISGIVIMNMSSYYSRLNKPKNACLIIDLLPSIKKEELSNILSKRNNYNGLLHPKFIDYIKKYDLNSNVIKEFKFEIFDTYGYSNAQVICGGVDVSQVNDNLSLKIDESMYLCGELLDIDGICGGYNLLFAFASALVIADNILLKIKNENIN